MMNSAKSLNNHSIETLTMARSYFALSFLILLLASAGCTPVHKKLGYGSRAELTSPHGQQDLVKMVQGGGLDAIRAAELLATGDPEITAPVLPDLLRIYSENCKVVESIDESDELIVWDTGCEHLRQISQRFGAPAVPELQKLNPFAAAIGLGAMGYEGFGGVSTLIAALGSEHPPVRIEAANALRNIAVRQDHIMAALQRVQRRDPDQGVRDAAQRAYTTLLSAVDEPPEIQRVVQTPQPEPARQDPVAPIGTARPNDLAIIIGIESYRGEVPDSTGARRDAQTFAELAESHLGLSRRNIIVLLDDQATHSSLQSYLEEWLPKNARQDGRVYVFFAGHGAPDPQTGDGYLVPWDGDPRFITRQGISIDDLTANLQLLPTQQVVLMLDSCFSGNGGRSILASGTRPLVPIKEIEIEENSTTDSEFIMLAAASADEVTGMTHDGQHGLFSYFLFSGIRGDADKNQDGQITLGELADHIAGTVPDEARRDNRSQTPVSRFLPASSAETPLVVFQ